MVTIYFNLMNGVGPLSTFAIYRFPLSQFAWLWTNWLQNNLTFVSTIWGVARSSYRLEWHPTSHSALMWRCRRILRRRPKNLYSFVSSRCGGHRHLGLHRFLFYGAGKRCTVIVEVNLFYSDCRWCKIIVIIIVLSFRR